MDILRLLDDLHEMVVSGPRHVGILKLSFGINPEEAGMLIAKIRASLPTEVKQAVNTVREKDRIVSGAQEDATLVLENARREAERILDEARVEANKVVEHARAQQDRMIHESEVLKLAKAQAEEVRSIADRDSIQMRRGAEGYALDVLNQLESVVGRVMTAVERGKSEIDRTEDRALVQTQRRG